MRLLLVMLLVIVALAMHAYGLPYRELSPQSQQVELGWYGDDRASQVQNDVFSSYKDDIPSEQIPQFNWEQSQQDTFNGYETHPLEPQRQNNPDYIYQSDQILQPYPNAIDSLTVTCSGENKVCVAKNLCINGYVHPLKQGFTRPGSECKLTHETCCTIQYDLDNSPYDNTVLKDNRFPEPTLENDQKYIPYGENNQPDVTILNPPLENDAELQSASNDGFAIQSTVNQPTDNIGGADASEPIRLPPKAASTNSAVFQFPVQSGCAAALLCVEEQYCTLEGVISTQPVTFTAKQLLRRVPLSSCRDRETGVVGKCCRDPNYVDPWPTGNLPANYTGGFDEQGFPTFLNIAKVRPPKKPVAQPTKTIPKHEPHKVPIVPVQIHEQPTSVIPLLPDDSDISQHVIPISTQIPIVVSTPSPFIQTTPYDLAPSNEEPISIIPQLPKYQCGIRNYNQRPIDMRETDVAFGEIPWQAMVLWSEERKILCSGVLIAPNAVLTAANCVNRFSPNELSVKLGEWKLGYEIKHEEPLPFEIINVQDVQYHPGYIEGLPSNDTAMLLLKHPATFNLHVNTLCLPDDYQIQETSQCIVTGWGKSILQAHYAGVTMHMVDVNLLSHDVCQNRIYEAESHIPIENNVICGKAHEENNMCQADVGAPLACYDGNGAYRLAGIYSQDTGCLPTNQVATFAPIDIAWLKQTMHNSHPSGTELDTIQTTIDDGYDYRKSNLPAINQYLPPINQYLPAV